MRKARLLCAVTRKKLDQYEAKCKEFNGKLQEKTKQYVKLQVSTAHNKQYSTQQVVQHTTSSTAHNK